ncbi:MAG: hypothetical protein ACXIT9_08405 [Nitritalea sp.]
MRKLVSNYSFAGWMLLVFVLLSSGCHNIFSYEEISPCTNRPAGNFVREHTSRIGLVRFIAETGQFVIQARLGDADSPFVLLDACNLPPRFQQSDVEIRFFGREFSGVDANGLIPFEITWIENVRRR